MEVEGRSSKSLSDHEPASEATLHGARSCGVGPVFFEVGLGSLLFFRQNQVLEVMVAGLNDAAVPMQSLHSELFQGRGAGKTAEESLHILTDLLQDGAELLLILGNLQPFEL